jgi:ribonuclease-3 family protein
MNKANINEYSTAALAYLGDAVIELLTRRLLVCTDTGLTSDRLNTLALGYVTAAAQSAAAERLLPHLREDEFAVYKRGRNAKLRVPKSASHRDYYRATGLEALFGYLYLTGAEDRASELFAAAFTGTV